MLRVHFGSDVIHVWTASSEETAAVGHSVGRRLEPNDVILIYGDLGAGKTTFVQGIGRALGSLEPVTSPTFTLIHEYHARGNRIVHVDPYRLAGPDDVEGMGFLDYLNGDSIVVVEWADRLADLAPPKSMRVRIVHQEQDNREIEIEWSDPRMKDLAADVEALQ